MKPQNSVHGLKSAARGSVMASPLLSTFVTGLLNKVVARGSSDGLVVVVVKGAGVVRGSMAVNQGLLARRLGQPRWAQLCLAGSLTGPGSRVTAPSRNELSADIASVSIHAS